MSTQIQFLRTDQPQLRPDPNVLANGMPLLNFNEQEPGLFFKARDGSLVKMGPTSVGISPPNSGATGYPGNTLGELWLDTSGLVTELKVYDGNDWVIPGFGGTRVSSVGLSMPSAVFEVENTPITSAGTLEVNLLPQARNRVLAGPLSGSAQLPEFRALASDDLPDLNASKVTTGIFSTARIPSLDASKITSGVFDPTRIPGIDATKIISGVLPYSFGGTGTGATPTNGELLIGGGSAGWNKTTLTAGNGIDIINGAGTIGLKVNPAGASGQIQFNNGGVLGANTSMAYDSVSDTVSLNATVSVDGPGLRYEYQTSPTPAQFVTSNSRIISLQAPGSAAANIALTLPASAPASSTSSNVVVSSTSGQLSFADALTLEDLSVRDDLNLVDVASGNQVTVSAPALGANYSLTLPTAVGSGGLLTSGPSGDLSFTTDPGVNGLYASNVYLTGGSPSRRSVDGQTAISVSSDGSYTLFEVSTNSRPLVIQATVMAYNTDVALGTGVYTATYNLHFDGLAAVLGTAFGVCDSWTAPAQPSFAADLSGGNLRLRTTTSSGSDLIYFTVRYTYLFDYT